MSAEVDVDRRRNSSGSSVSHKPVSLLLLCPTCY